MYPTSQDGQPDFLFLPYAPHRTRKDLELQESQVRAHAARKSHAFAKHRRDTLLAGSIRRPQNGFQFRRCDGSLNNLSQSLEKSLSQDRWDPFDSFAVKRLPRYIHKLLELASDLKWENLKPTTLHQPANPMKRAWLHAAIESPSVLHAMIFGMLSSLALMRSPSEITRALCLKHQTQSIELLQKELQTPPGQRLNENLLLAVINLGAHGKPLQVTGIPQGYPESPLAKTQNLHLHGLMESVREHKEAIYVLIEQLGGIDSIRLFGLRDAIELCDICYATRFGTNAKLPWRHPVQPLISDVGYTPDMTGQKLLSLKNAFLSYNGLNDRYIEVIGLSRELIAGLDQYQRGGVSAPSLQSLVRARNAVQHKMVSLRPLDGHLTSLDDQATEISRISLVLFSNMVFFPLPQATKVVFRSVTSLRHTIKAATTELWSLRLDLLTWALVLGGIAAFSTVHYRWFVATFQRHLIGRLNNWESMKRVLEAHMWWDYMCQEPGKRFCNEARFNTETSLMCMV